MRQRSRSSLVVDAGDSVQGLRLVHHGLRRWPVERCDIERRQRRRREIRVEEGREEILGGVNDEERFLLLVFALVGVVVVFRHLEGLGPLRRKRREAVDFHRRYRSTHIAFRCADGVPLARCEPERVQRSARFEMLDEGIGQP